MERISPEKALELVLGRVRAVDGTERVPLINALGRVCACDIAAAMDNPPFDRSAMDGYALRSEDTAHASAGQPVRLRVTGAVYAGDAPEKPLQRGEAVRIMTGAMFPPLADCVLMQENASPDGAGSILVSAPVNRGENYIRRGEDVRKGQRLAEAGMRLNFAALGVLASMGLRDVPVRRLPAVGLLCTGDELVRAGVPLPPGKIYSSNETLLEARLRELGFAPAVLGTGADDASAAARQIEAAIGGLDALITTGAVSVGEKDIFHEVFALLGAERLFWRLNTKPGGATLCGIYRGKPLLCLSGNPFAALTGFEVIARPVLDRLSGGNGDAARQKVRVAADIEAKGVRRFMRARTGNGEARLGDSHLSGQLFSLAACNCLLDVPADTPVRAGDELDALMF